MSPRQRDDIEQQLAQREADLRDRAQKQSTDAVRALRDSMLQLGLAAGQSGKVMREFAEAIENMDPESIAAAFEAMKQEGQRRASAGLGSDTSRCTASACSRSTSRASS